MSTSGPDALGGVDDERPDAVTGGSCTCDPRHLELGAVDPGCAVHGDES